MRRVTQCGGKLMSNFKVRVSPSFWVVSFITHLSCLKLTIFTSCWLDVVFLFCNKGCWNLRAVVPCNSEKWPLKTLSYSYNKKLSFESLKPFSMVPVLAWVLISVCWWTIKFWVIALLARLDSMFLVAILVSLWGKPKWHLHT